MSSVAEVFPDSGNCSLLFPHPLLRGDSLGSAGAARSDGASDSGNNKGTLWGRKQPKVSQVVLNGASRKWCSTSHFH